MADDAQGEGMPAEVAGEPPATPSNAGADTTPGVPRTDDTQVMAPAAAGAGAGALVAPGPVTRDEPIDAEARGPSALTTVLLVLALLLGAAGLGVAIYAAHKTAQPGTSGAHGKTGATGAAGPAGPAGAQGPAGPPGTVVSPRVTAGSVVATSPSAPAATTLTASTQCPVGKILLSGGADVTAPGAAKDVALQSSFASSATTWQTTAVVLTALPTGDVMTLKPYVLCGSEPVATPTTTTTT
jgi:hypothetical protein